MAILNKYDPISQAIHEYADNSSQVAVAILKGYTSSLRYKVILLGITLIMEFLLHFSITYVSAGPFGYGDGYEPYPPIHKDAPELSGWADGWLAYEAGAYVDDRYKTPEKALGKAEGNAYDIVCLGRRGSIIMTFDPPVCNGMGWDFAVFENSFSDDFLELAYVEVSSDGERFIRFPCCSLTPEAVSAYGTIDPTNIIGLAGKYRQGYGTPFDLQDLAGMEEVDAGILKLDRIRFIRVIDVVGDGIVGDGTCYDSRISSWQILWGENAPIYDPYPTFGSAGFDLDAVGVRYCNTTPEDVSSLNVRPLLSYPGDQDTGVPVTPTLYTDNYFDTNALALPLKTCWQISTKQDFSGLALDLVSIKDLTSLSLVGPVLQYEKEYYWRVRFFEPGGAWSEWSDAYSFFTSSITDDTDLDGIPNNCELYELESGNAIDLNADGIPDIDQIDSKYKCLKTLSDNDGYIAIKADTEGLIISCFESIDPNTLPEKETRPGNMRLGLLGIRLEEASGPSESTIGVTIYPSLPPSPETRWFFYDLKEGWKGYPATDTVDSADERNYIALTLQDGGQGDIDGVENGVIVSIGGPTYPPQVTPPADGQSGFGDFKGLEGCFIGSAAKANDIVRDRDGDRAKAIGDKEQLSENRTAKEYKRIISLAPSITEVLFALGLGDKVVGVTDFCDYPKEAKTKGKIGGYYDTSYEAILILKPDLVIMLPEHERQKGHLSSLDIETFVVDQRSIDGIMDSIISIGKVCGKEKEASQILEDITSRIQGIKKKTGGLSTPRVMICIGRSYGAGTLEDIYICGKKGFYNEILTLAGGINAYEGQKIRYPSISAEGIMRINPEVIIEVIPDLYKKGFDTDTIVKDWELLIGVGAVKNRRIHIFGEEHMATPGPRFILILEQMAKALHPEIKWE